MKTIISSFLIIAVFSGCVSNPFTEPFLGMDTSTADGKKLTGLEDVVIHGILLAHPELSYDEAKREAKQYYIDNKESIDAAKTRLSSALYLADYISVLLKLQGGFVNGGE